MGRVKYSRKQLSALSKNVDEQLNYWRERAIALEHDVEEHVSTIEALSRNCDQWYRRAVDAERKLGEG